MVEVECLEIDFAEHLADPAIKSGFMETKITLVPKTIKHCHNPHFNSKVQIKTKLTYDYQQFLFFIECCSCLRLIVTCALNTLHINQTIDEMFLANK